jgi:hypothetical protein
MISSQQAKRKKQIMSQKSRLSVFGVKPDNAIIVPELPLNARNNCQSGKWTIGDDEYGSKIEMTILKFSKFFGSLGQTSNTIWGQIWFVVESGEFPKNVVMVTYIKGRSLRDFSRSIASVQSKGIEPAEGIFAPEFIKHSGQRPDETGIVKPINYYSLKWNWNERSDWSMVDKAAAVLEEQSNHSLMVDLEGTANMVCIDHLPPHQVAKLMGADNEPEKMLMSAEQTF